MVEPARCRQGQTPVNLSRSDPADGQVLHLRTENHRIHKGSGGVEEQDVFPGTIERESKTDSLSRARIRIKHEALATGDRCSSRKNELQGVRGIVRD